MGHINNRLASLCCRIFKLIRKLKDVLIRIFLTGNTEFKIKLSSESRKSVI